MSGCLTFFFCTHEYISTYIQTLDLKSRKVYILQKLVTFGEKDWLERGKPLIFIVFLYSSIFLVMACVTLLSEELL